MDKVATRLHITHWEQWYEVTQDKLLEAGAGRVSVFYEHTPLYMLPALYPYYNWKLWKFPKVPNSYWEDLQNQRKYLEDMMQQWQVSLDQLHEEVTVQKLKDYGGNGLLRQYNFSPTPMLQAVFPENDWMPWRCSKIRQEYWQSLKNQRKFMMWLAQKLNVVDVSSNNSNSNNNDNSNTNSYDNNSITWYQLTAEHIKEHGGGGLLTHYNNSLHDLLTSVFPNYSWEPWRLGVAETFWNHPQNLKQYFDWITTTK